MKTQLGLIFSSLALTVLIWTYADQSGHETYTTTAPVRFVPPPRPDNPTVVRVEGARSESPNVERVEIALRGPKSAIRRLEKDDAAGRFQLTVVIPDEQTQGPVSRDLFEDLNRLPEIRNRGLSLQKVAPERVQLVVDRYRDVPIAVEVVPGLFERSLADSLVVEPETVRARVLESALPREGSLGPLRLLIEEQLQSRSERIGGGPFSFNLPLRSNWPGVEAAFRPDHVRVTGEFIRRTTSERITPIPLAVMVKPQDFFEKYEIEWQDETGGHLTQAIDVRVPLEKAGRLRGSDVDAYIIITDLDLPRDLPGGPTTSPAPAGSWIEREVRFVFPPGFEDVKIEGPPRTVFFRVNRKAEAAGGPSAAALP
jgi:hypothetical protein